VAGSAIHTARSADALGNLQQTDALGRHTGSRRILLVGTDGVVANQTVDGAFVAEVEFGVLPAVPDVTTGAAGLVGGN